MTSKVKIISSNNLNLWTDQLSNDSKRQVCILISGAGAPAMFWTDLFCEELVKAGYTVIRFDHRDQGLSDAVDWGKTPYTIEDLAKDVIKGAQLITEFDSLHLNLNADTTVLNIISFNSGEFKRGMSDKAEIVGVYYIETDNDLKKLNIETICDKLAKFYKTKIDFLFKSFHYPTINSSRETGIVIESGIEIYGDKKVKILEKSMIAAEDFSGKSVV